MSRPFQTPRLLAAGICLGVLGAGPTSANGALAECLTIESAVKRLACFEDVATTRKTDVPEASTVRTNAPKPPQVRDEPATAARSAPATTKQPAAVQQPASASPGKPEPTDFDDDEQKRRGWLPSFRKDRSEATAEPNNTAPEFRVESRIVSARRASRYDPWVLTLANGEVWRENEPAVQRIRAEQDVVITKGALNYSMRLANGRTILVRKLR